MVSQPARDVACRPIWACKAHGCCASHAQCGARWTANAAHRGAVSD